MSKLLIIASIVTIGSSQSLRTVTGTSYEVDDALNRALLDKHNELRNNLALDGLDDTSYNSGNPDQPSDLSQPTATYMHELHYDEGLAILAQEYLNTWLSGTPTNLTDDICNLRHNGNRGTDFVSNYQSYATFAVDPAVSSIGIGENILSYTGSYSNVVDLSVSQAVSGWWDEYKWLDYSGEACYEPTNTSSCGHYSQMAWADTRYIGCGTITCGSSGTVITLCNYYPAGNVGNKRYGFQNNTVKQPYPTGTPCSTCDTDAEDRTECDGTSSGLCSGCQSEYFAYDPNDCSDEWYCGGYSCPSWACPDGDITINENTNMASCSASWVSKTCAQAQDEDIPFSKVLNGHFCTSCGVKCGTCTESTLTAAACTGDGLDYTASPTPSPTAASPAQAQGEIKSEGYVLDQELEADTVVVTRNADWAIAGMCMICALCSIMMGIGYYLHSKKVSNLKMELKAQKLINNEETNQNNVQESEDTETIDMTVNIEERGESVEAEAIIDETTQ